MIPIPVSTVEHPLTVIDYIAQLEQASSITEVQQYAERVPYGVRHDERFGRAVAQRLKAINERKAAA